MSHSRNQDAASTPVAEGGQAPSPTDGGHGHAKPAASRAETEGSPEAGTSSATAGKAEKEHAAQAGAMKDQHGRGHRKGE